VHFGYQYSLPMFTGSVNRCPWTQVCKIAPAITSDVDGPGTWPVNNGSVSSRGLKTVCHHCNNPRMLSGCIMCGNQQHTYEASTVITWSVHRMPTVVVLLTGIPLRPDSPGSPRIPFWLSTASPGSPYTPYSVKCIHSHNNTQQNSTSAAISPLRQQAYYF